MSKHRLGDDNPFRELPDSNPYAAPTTAADVGAAPTNPVQIPGVILIVLSAAFLLFLLASTPLQILRLIQSDTSTPEGFGELTGGIVALVGWFAVTGSILYGSICMVRMKGYSSAFIAAVAALIPCCSPFFITGIPFGIWALFMLMKPGVRERFE